MKTIGKLFIALFFVFGIFFVWHLFGGAQVCWGDPSVDADNNSVADNCFVSSE